jgi:hypothetical protein
MAKVLHFKKSFNTSNNSIPPASYNIGLNLFNEALRKPPRNNYVILTSVFACCYASLVVTPTVFFKVEGSVRINSDFVFSDQTNSSNNAFLLFPLWQFCTNVDFPLTYGIYNRSASIISTTFQTLPNLALADIAQVTCELSLNIEYRKN